MTVIVPAFNERLRLPGFLSAARRYLDSAHPDAYEVIVVDDGSVDGTLDLIESLSASWPQLATIRHLHNAGKGAAVKTGMLSAQGDFWLFADADGATPLSEEAQLRAAIDAGADLAIGSRTAASIFRQRSRTVLRSAFSRLFSLLCRRSLGLGVRDTQCGFKMFRRDVGQRLFANLVEPGFAFDLELLALAKLERYRVAEVPVHWREKPGSKVRIIRDGWRMLNSLISIRRRLKADNRGPNQRSRSWLSHAASQSAGAEMPIGADRATSVRAESAADVAGASQ